MGEDEWTVVFYVEPSGNEPVREFLTELDLKTQARFDWSIEQLRVRNLRAHEPLVKHLEGKLWELRRESSTNVYRLLYCLLSKKRILFLHGISKKTQKTPRREIEVAHRRLANFLESEGGA